MSVPVSVGPAATYAADALLRDGTSVRVRAIRPDDKERLRAHFLSLGGESVHFRFFGAKKDLTAAELAYFTELDFEKHVGLVAVRQDETGEHVLAVARYLRCDGEPGGEARGELATAVADAWQGRGLGTVMLEHLCRVAARNGVTEIVADVLGANTRMMSMLERSGFQLRESPPGRVLHVAFTTEPTERFVRASEERAWQAASRSMAAFMDPRSVAVVGASRQPNSIGYAILRNLVQDGFPGPIYPINAKADEILGRKAYPRLADVPGPVDLVVISVPAAAAEDVVAEAGRIGARGVVVITAGFAEVSEEGRAAQLRLRHIARASGMRLVGPNCMGIVNTAAKLNATFVDTHPVAGNVGIMSQSGALGYAVLEHARTLNLGISSFVSAGNKADVSGNDLLAYWRDDPATDVIALYLESFGNPRRFALLAPEVAREKPIVAVKAGRGAAGTRAASSHSAALGCLDFAVDALFEQAGVIRTETLEDLYDVVSLLATQPIPRGRRVGVVTNAGGPGILLVDACEARGLAVPELSDATQDGLRGFLHTVASVKNPVDMIASAGPGDYEAAIAAVGADPSVDAVVVIFVPPVLAGADEVAAGIARGAARVPADKPVLNVFLADRGVPEVLASGARGRLPSFSFPENAARALAAVQWYADWRSRPRGRSLRLDDEARGRIRAVVDRAMAGRNAPFWLDADPLHEVFAAAGIPFAAARTVSLDDAVRIAPEIGFPLVMKAVAPGLLHKSDVGGVALGLDSPDAVREAVERMRESLREAGHELEAVQLQPQVERGIEALVGVVTDPSFGPLVACGMGGVFVELLKDASFRMVPVTDVDATAMIDRLRMRPLFDGYRGAPAGDREALVEIVMKVSALAEALPEMTELDLNPVMVLRPGEGAVAVDARLRIDPAAAR